MRTDYTKGQNVQPHTYSSPQQSGTSGKKVMLIFPPDWYPSKPYLSLPTLTAFLRGAGHRVVQKDVNLEMYDWFFSENCLQLVLEKIPKQLDRLKKLSREQGFTDEVVKLQQALRKCNQPYITMLTEKAESAKTIVRSQEFYNVDKLEWAMNIFREVTHTISLVYAPARICIPPMETGRQAASAPNGKSPAPRGRAPRTERVYRTHRLARGPRCRPRLVRRITDSHISQDPPRDPQLPCSARRARGR